MRWHKGLRERRKANFRRPLLQSAEPLRLKPIRRRGIAFIVDFWSQHSKIFP
jgi:hypothetical protein